MYNLAGIDSRVTSELCTVELSKAGVALMHDHHATNGEVQSHITGLLTYKDGEVSVEFRRLWYYWSVHLSRPLPQAVAEVLNKKWEQEIRVDGYAGGKSPDPRGVTVYHVDTQEGLNALVIALNEHFGAATIPEPQPLRNYIGILPPMPAKEVDNLLELAMAYGAGSDSRNKGLVEEVLLTATSKAQANGLSAQIGIAISQLLAFLEKQRQFANRIRRSRAEQGDRKEWEHYQMDYLNYWLRIKTLGAYCRKAKIAVPGLVETLASLPNYAVWRKELAALKKALRQNIKERHSQLTQASDESNRQFYNERICLNTLFLTKVAFFQSLKRQSNKYMQQARAINENLRGGYRLDNRFPEHPAWKRYPEGSLARALQATSLHSYPY